MDIYYSPQVNLMFCDANYLCEAYRHEFFTPVHCLLALFRQEAFTSAVYQCASEPETLQAELRDDMSEIEAVPSDIDFTITPSVAMRKVLQSAANQVAASNGSFLTIPHIVKSIIEEQEELHTASILAMHLHEGDGVEEFMSVLISNYEKDTTTMDHVQRQAEIYDKARNGHDDDMDDLLDDDFDLPDDMDTSASPFAVKDPWLSLVTNVSEAAANYNPLVGRDAELERTIQVLCRKEKNNVLHIGEPGVGKTALVYGLAMRINSGNVPEKLLNATIYQIDMGSLVAGTQFRGDFEKRLKQIMDGMASEDNAIAYIDEIHNIVGVGNTGEGSLDASDIIKPYLEEGRVRFIGSTTYEDYNRRLSKSKALVRRFQQIDITEPSIDEAINILNQLKPRYEKFHGVKYADKAIEFAVKASAKHINERYLPDKAIDLIDEAGAYRVMHPLSQKRQTVDKALIAEILSKVCKVDALAMKETGNATLETLGKRILSLIYGQDEAVRQVVEAVQMSKAGLTDDNKPMASLLFVGPTGVGKTEVAKILAQEMGIELVRFDMSEYTEKHTVAKLIGSPAGYVGYEDGGLLTDAIRKTPNCVLLLDEIEKAHEDIYNILLQVMDYARLTDNKGRKADFRNVVLIMTSNAGAQYAAQANIGFDRHVSASEAMMKQVKKTFKPEFINRLSGTVMFNDMDRHMASLILDKKLRLLQDKLTVRKVELILSNDAREYLLEKGFTREYGAREIDRVIANELKPLLMREILFGKLKKGGKVCVGAASPNSSEGCGQPKGLSVLRVDK